MIVLIAPTANSTATVEIADTSSARPGSKKIYAHTGTAAPDRYDKADGERGAEGTVERFCVEAQLLAHHHVAPSLGVRRDVRDDLIEQRPANPLFR